MDLTLPSPEFLIVDCFIFGRFNELLFDVVPKIISVQLGLNAV